MSHNGIRRQVLHKEIILTEKEKTLLQVAVRRRLDCRKKSRSAYDRLMGLGLIDQNGTITAEGRRTASCVSRMETRKQGEHTPHIPTKLIMLDEIMRRTVCPVQKKVTLREILGDLPVDMLFEVYKLVLDGRELIDALFDLKDRMDAGLRKLREFLTARDIT